MRRAAGPGQTDPGRPDKPAQGSAHSHRRDELNLLHLFRLRNSEGKRGRRQADRDFFAAGRRISEHPPRSQRLQALSPWGRAKSVRPTSPQRASEGRGEPPPPERQEKSPDFQESHPALPWHFTLPFRNRENHLRSAV